MSLLAAFLIARTIAETADIARSVAATAHTAAAAANIASSVATMKRENAARKAINDQRLAYQAASVQAKPAETLSTYDLDLFYAKMATLSYIAKSDNKISQEERDELEQTLAVANNMYGYEAVANARNIFYNGGSSFTVLESYLMKVQERDLDAFLFYANEYAKADKWLMPEEQIALQKLRSYIEARKGKKSFYNLSCPSCGAAMSPDSYGYKASCEHCGYEVILNTDNAPRNFITYPKCSRCGVSFNGHRNAANIRFCSNCGGQVVVVTEPAQPSQTNTASRGGYAAHTSNGPNLYISYRTINPDVLMVTRIVSTGVKHTYVNGQEQPFRLEQGPHQIVLKIGKKNYNRDIVIQPGNKPVRIYASFNGRAQISVDQPAY